MKLSEKLKEYRKVFDLSQEQLAEKLNVSRQVITKWESEIGLPEIGNLKALAELFCVSIDYLLDDEKGVEYPIIKEKYKIEKNNFSNRYDFAVSYLKEHYSDSGIIYSLTQTQNGERNLATKIFSFLTVGVSDISYVTQWFGDLAIWFLVETDRRKLLIKVTKEFIEMREISNLIDADKFTYEKSKFSKVQKL